MRLSLTPGQYGNVVRLAGLVLALWGSRAEAGIITDYLASYQPGIEAGNYNTATPLSYDAPTPTGTLPSGCAQDQLNAKLMHCSASLNSPGRTSLGLFLQQPFKRTGWLYFGKDVGLSAYSLDANLTAPSANQQTAQSPAQPLTTARIHLYGAIAKGYLTLGVTPPRILPDALLSVGLGEEATGGNVVIQGERRTIIASSMSYYLAIELVWLRFHKTGALSSAIAEDWSNASKTIYNGRIDGMSNFRVSPSKTDLSLIKLLFAGWP